MKHYYLLFSFIVFFSLNANSQTDLIGTWYLDYIVKDGITYPNYFNDMTVFKIEFTNEVGWLPNSLGFSIGHGCETSQGIFIADAEEITFQGVTTLSFDCATKAHSQYNNLFFEEFDYDNSGNGSTHDYVVSGDGSDEVLTLTNLNSNSLVYKKQQPQGILVSTWWLHHIDIPGNPIIDIPEGDSPYLNLTNEIFVPLPFLPELDGVGECESFNAKYSVSFNGANNLNISEFVETLSACATQAYEGIYFEILRNDTTNFFEFEIIDDGSTLILTDLLGARLIFGDTSLSLDEYDENQYDISLLQNPVEDKLILNLESQILSENIEYKIYSIDGKQVKSSILSSDSINVEDIVSGVYFISFAIEDSFARTLKFIKK